MAMVTIGKIGKPFGVHGWLIIHSFSDPLENILTYPSWTLHRDDQNLEDQIYPEDHEIHHQHIVCRFPGCHTPEDARRYTHATITIDRSLMPPLPEGEYYWTDLEGLTVLNDQDDRLGTVDKVDNHGPHDLLYVKQGKTLYTIPYVDSIIQSVDLKLKTIVVRWPVDATS